jgi:hypothetical protein
MKKMGNLKPNLVGPPANWFRLPLLTNTEKVPVINVVISFKGTSQVVRNFYQWLRWLRN